MMIMTNDGNNDDVGNLDGVDSLFQLAILQKFRNKTKKKFTYLTWNKNENKTLSNYNNKS